MNKKKSTSLYLIKTNIKKFNDYIIESTEDKLNIGLDLTNNNSGYKIDLIRYGKDII